MPRIGFKPGSSSDNRLEFDHDALNPLAAMARLNFFFNCPPSSGIASCVGTAGTVLAYT